MKLNYHFSLLQSFYDFQHSIQIKEFHIPIALCSVALHQQWKEQKKGYVLVPRDKTWKQSWKANVGKEKKKKSENNEKGTNSERKMWALVEWPTKGRPSRLAFLAWMGRIRTREMINTDRVPTQLHCHIDWHCQSWLWE